jgi:hypothetical protein
MRRVEQDFHSSGQPLHVADPARSMFRIMTLQQLNQMEDKELQYLHAHHHLLITGYPQPPYGFDAKGLAMLAPPSRVFTIHGASYIRNMHNSHLNFLNRLFHPYNRR